MAGHSNRMPFESLKNKKNIWGKHGVYSMNMYLTSYKNTIDDVSFYTIGKIQCRPEKVLIGKEREEHDKGLG